MKIKKIWLLAGIVFLSANGYCGLRYEAELAQKFCPSLQLHSRDQGVSPKPVEIMSNGRADGITTYLDENDVWCRTFTFTIPPELVGDIDINDNWKVSGWEKWPVSIYYSDNVYNEEPVKIIGRPPGKAAGVYLIFFHYDFGGPGRDSSSTWYQDYHNLSGLYNDTIYAHVFPLGDKALIQYWFLYPFNDWVNNHEGDWEHINVVVSSQDPATAKIEYVDYYFHHHVKECTQPGVDFFVDNQTHPVVFVGGHGSKAGHSGEGSHGSYSVKGYWNDAASAALGYYINEDIDGSGEFLSYKGFDLKMIPNRDEIVYGRDPDLYWMRSNILWGHRDVDSIADWAEFSPKYELGNSPPIGPNFHNAWNNTGENPKGGTPESYEYKKYTKTPPHSPATNSGYTIPKVGTITGRITDKQTGIPISGATIKVVDKTRSATTDKDGRYKIVLPVGKYKLHATKTRYGGRSQEINVSEGDNLNVDFSLFLIQYTFTPSNIWIESQQEFNKWAFIDCPGLASGVYLKVKRYEVRAKITFPKEFIEPPDILQIQTNGLSGANPNKGST